MNELWQQICLSYNLPITILLGLVVLYWLLSLLGFAGGDGLDLDADLDVDVDVDGNVGATTEGLGIVGGCVKFLNGAHVPLMLILSILTLSTWTFCISANYAINRGESGLLGWGIFLVSCALSIPVTKIVTMPLVPLFKKLKEQEQEIPIVGQTGIVISSKVDESFGRVEVAREGGAPALISCVSYSGKTIPKNWEVLVESYDKEKEIYIVSTIEN